MGEGLVQARNEKGRKFSFCVGLITFQTEVADMPWFLRCPEIISLNRAGHAPAFRGAVEISNPAFALPLDLVRFAVAAARFGPRRHARLINGQQKFGLGRIGRVEQLIADEPIRPHHIRLVGIAIGQRRAVA